MSKSVYEAMFILDSNRYARDASGVVAQIPSTVEQFGGEMLASRLWEERRLAYPIRGHRKGTYWLTYFRMDGAQFTNLTSQLQLNESILRSLVLKIDARIADAMVQHAITGGPPVERKPPVAPQVEMPAIEVPDLEELAE